MVVRFFLSRNQIARIAGNDPEAIRAVERLVSIASTLIYTEEDQAKLAGIEAGAQVNVPTDLSYNAGTRQLSSSTGADVTLPLATVANAGLGPARSGSSAEYLNGAGAYSVPAGGGGSQVLAMLGL